MEADTDKTIDALVSELKPVQRVKPFGRRLGLWMAASFFVVGAFVAVIGVPRNLDNVMHTVRLAFDAGIVGVLAVVASSSALRLSVPGEERAMDRLVPMGVLITWTLVTISELINAANVGGVCELTTDDHYACAALVTSLAAVLSVPLTMILRRAAPLDKWWCGALAGLACGATAMIGIEMICVYERPAHVLVWHVVPVIGLTIAGALLGPKLLTPPARN